MMDAPPSYTESQAQYSNSPSNYTPPSIPPPQSSVSATTEGPRLNQQGFLRANEIEIASLRQVLIVQPKPEVITDRRLLEPPSDLSCFAFLACAFCCLFTGIIALAYTDEVQRHQQNGNIIQANKANRIVRNLIIASVVLGSCLYLIGIILVLVSVLD